MVYLFITIITTAVIVGLIQGTSKEREQNTKPGGKSNSTSKETYDNLLTDDSRRIIKFNHSQFTKSHEIEIPSSDGFQTLERYLNEGEYFHKFQTICSFTNSIHGSGTIFIQLPYSGKLEKYLVTKPNNITWLNAPILCVSEIENKGFIDDILFEQHLTQLNQNELNVISDDFDDSETIKFAKISGEDTSYFKLYEEESNDAYDYLGLKFAKRNSHCYIEFNTTNSEISLAKGDSLILLFQDKTKEIIVFDGAGYGRSGDRYNHKFVEPPFYNIFLTKKLDKIKAISKRKNLYSIYVIDHQINQKQTKRNVDPPQYYTKKEGQYLLNLISELFTKTLKQKNIAK